MFELFLKSNAILSFGIGFSMSESPLGTNFQPDWSEIRSNLEGWGKLINQSLWLSIEDNYKILRSLLEDSYKTRIRVL